jgi:hypothetical protein
MGTMAARNDYAKLDPQSDTLSSLSDTHRAGLIAAGTAALISFISTTTLFLFISYKLIAGLAERWYRPGRAHVAANELTLGLPDRRHALSESFCHQQQLEGASKSTTLPMSISDEQPRNPFPLLIYNLLLSEMQTTLGYALNIEWVVRNGVYVGTTTCWAQGWLNNIGILSSSIFLVSISINTYLSVVRGWRPPQWFIRAWIAFCWILSLALTSAGIIQSNNGRAEGGWFVRANTWVGRT